VQRLVKLERELPNSLERATRELGQVRDRVDQLQLVAASSIFGTLERTARDAAVSLGKRALFEAQGGDLRLESSVLTAVQHALVQAVRNAVAHGIEPINERTQRGKPAEGRVTLDVRRRGRRICFVCRDDGRGVDVGRVRHEAARLGRIVEGGRAPSDAELLGLLLQGGISTTTHVTEVAGRGVGLDLIREALSSVGGTVALDSRPGAGTSLTLEVPASLAALEVLLVEAAGGIHALPLASVVRALRVGDGELSLTAEGAALRFEQQIVPFLPLARLLRGSATRERKLWSAVVIRDGEDCLALGVDRLLGAESLVARALPDSAELDATVAAISLDVDGNPRLVLDPRGLLESAKRPPTEAVASAPRQRVVLVVDDSLTTRMLEQSILESAGYEVDLATSGEQGLEKARARSYDLLLVDVEMPGMDGFTVVEQIRADPRLAPTPVVLVTSRVSPADLARGKAAGANAHIAKGEFDQVEFLERIDRLTR
jgi:two-component system chemotaxis sensor kinase CheA